MNQKYIYIYISHPLLIFGRQLNAIYLRSVYLLINRLLKSSPDFYIEKPLFLENGKFLRLSFSKNAQSLRV